MNYNLNLCTTKQNAIPGKEQSLSSPLEVNAKGCWSLRFRMITNRGGKVFPEGRKKTYYTD